MQMAEELDEESLQTLYAWIDDVPLSRPKKSITRDFSDGMLVAELIQHFLPKHVDMHNYSPANSSNQKMNNWGVLQRKVFSRLRFGVPEPVVRFICNCKPGVVEMVLFQLKVNKYQESIHGRPVAGLRGDLGRLGQLIIAQSPQSF
jgi:hypothetical protein